MKSWIWTIGIVLGLVACQNPPKRPEAKGTVDTPQPAQDDKLYGEAFEAEDVLTYEELLQAMEGQDSLVGVVVKGKVAEVCQKKGCWMTLVSEANGQEMMVRFKDYGFFVPKDLSGSTIVMKGNAYREVVPVDELRHYAEDAGKSKAEIEAITEPEVQMRFVASGVRVLDEG